MNTIYFPSFWTVEDMCKWIGLHTWLAVRFHRFNSEGGGVIVLEVQL